MLLAERENEVLRILDMVLRSGVSVIVVGGYAVSALARHRFSVDCDLVVVKKDVGRLESVIHSQGFSKEQQQAGFDRVYAGRFIRFVKKVAGLPVNVDLLVDSLVCRGTEGSWSFDYILSHSVEANIPGAQLSMKGRIPVRELLLAFKLHSARKADVRDIVTLTEDARWDRVLGHLNRGSPVKLRSSLNQVLRDLEDPRLVNSLKGVFSLKEDVVSAIAKTKEQVQRVMSKLEEVKAEKVKPTALARSAF